MAIRYPRWRQPRLRVSRVRININGLDQICFAQRQAIGPDLSAVVERARSLTSTNVLHRVDPNANCQTQAANCSLLTTNTVAVKSDNCRLLI